MIKLRPHQQRALDAMSKHKKGQIIVPTGGGKTMIMIQHAMRVSGKTIVVVAPRILLAKQLRSEFLEHIDCDYLHVHSGEKNGTTNPDEIRRWEQYNYHRPKLIFTTYHSLNRVISSGIDIDCAYLDEAHNSVAKSFFRSVAACSKLSEHFYSFTATPRIARKHDRGMNNADVYGTIIENTPAPELMANGSIIPPKLVPFKTDSDDAENLLNTVDELQGDKILVSAPRIKRFVAMLYKTDLVNQLKQRGYHVLHITSKYGAFIGEKKVDRETFFQALKDWGADKAKKFIVFHYKILSEGIDVRGLTHSILLRNLGIVEMAQTIGRVIRMDRQDTKSIQDGTLLAGNFHMYHKPCGFVSVPVPSNSNSKIVARLQKVTNSIFIDGIPPVSYVS
jgi:superfamily II DNA or RNA helicase